MRRLARSGAVAFLLFTAAGVILLAANRGVYLGLILVWAAPVLMVQWWLTGAVVAAAPRAWIRAWLPPTAYLWLADWIALRLGIWQINESVTIGLTLAGLPLEEAVFFLVTNLLTLHGALLLLEPWRLRAARPAVA